MQGMTSTKSLSRLVGILLALLLAACGTAPPKQAPAGARQIQATQLEQEGKYAEAAQLYEGLAVTAPPAQKNDFVVSAAEDWQLAGNAQRSWALLGGVKEQGLYPALAARVEILKAGLDLSGHQPQAALEHLRFAIDPLPEEIKAKALLVRGQVHIALGDLPSAVQDWSDRETHLAPGSSDVKANRELIWNTLGESHAPIDLKKLPAGLSPTARGWLELADIARTSWQQPDKFVEQVKAWQSRYPQHPAGGELVPGLLAKQQALTSFPPRLAVLLPLSGDYQSPADAVRDGLFAAYYQVADSGSAPSIALYDSGSTAASAQAAYQKAVAEGARMVIGPLTKDAVAGIAAQPSLPVPVLALNYLDGGKGGPSGFYQFGLLPEGEAEQAAERAVAEGRTRAVALVPNDDFGARMFNAFSARFKQLGGSLLGMQTYIPGSKAEAYTSTLIQLFNLDGSEEREQRLASTLGQHLEFEPRRRQDIQFIFLAASADDAQVVQPQINYNRAEDLPVYSTSKVYSLSSAVGVAVLNGISFDDMPWLLEDTGSVADMRAHLARYWPGNFADNSRLYALGFDAYRLVPLLYNTHDIGQPVQGVTGLLSLDASGRVHRKLDWASVAQGSIDLLDPVDLPTAAPVSAVQRPPKP